MVYLLLVNHRHPRLLGPDILGSDDARAPNIILWSSLPLYQRTTPYSRAGLLLLTQLGHVIFGLEVRFVFRARNVERGRERGIEVPSYALS